VNAANSQWFFPKFASNSKCSFYVRLRNGVKHSSLTRLPQVLIIHLKRFRHEGACNTKLRTRVTFPLFSLDMAPFMEPQALLDAQGRPVATEYDLCGLISHRGQNMECECAFSTNS
jgi:ubiquitin carboxyl-terminal hydrolase 20/33